MYTLEPIQFMCDVEVDMNEGQRLASVMRHTIRRQSHKSHIRFDVEEHLSWSKLCSQVLP
jgi:hypothetical protein